MLREEFIGTHSLQKGSATFSSYSGISRDVANERGRWCVKETIVDTHIDTTLPYEHTAATLCAPAEPCNYKMKARHQIDDNI